MLPAARVRVPGGSPFSQLHLVVADITSLTPLFSWLKGVPPGINPSSRQQKKALQSAATARKGQLDVREKQRKNLQSFISQSNNRINHKTPWKHWGHDKSGGGATWEIKRLEGVGGEGVTGRSPTRPPGQKEEILETTEQEVFWHLKTSNSQTFCFAWTMKAELWCSLPPFLKALASVARWIFVVGARRSQSYSFRFCEALHNLQFLDLRDAFCVAGAGRGPFFVAGLFFLWLFSTRFQPYDLHLFLCFSAKVTVRLDFCGRCNTLWLQVVCAWQGILRARLLQVWTPLKGAVQPYAMLCHVDDELHFFDCGGCNRWDQGLSSVEYFVDNIQNGL